MMIFVGNLPLANLKQTSIISVLLTMISKTIWTRINH